jgi:hypothetical protein
VPVSRAQYWVSAQAGRAWCSYFCRDHSIHSCHQRDLYSQLLPGGPLHSSRKCSQSVLQFLTLDAHFHTLFGSPYQTCFIKTKTIIQGYPSSLINVLSIEENAFLFCSSAIPHSRLDTISVSESRLQCFRECLYCCRFLSVWESVCPWEPQHSTVTPKRAIMGTLSPWYGLHIGCTWPCVLVTITRPSLGYMGTSSLHWLYFGHLYR